MSRENVLYDRPRLISDTLPVFP